MDKTYRYGKSVEIADFDLKTVDFEQRNLQFRIETVFSDAREYYWKLTDFPDTSCKMLSVSWVSDTVPWTHRCRFNCPLEQGAMI